MAGRRAGAAILAGVRGRAAVAAAAVGVEEGAGVAAVEGVVDGVVGRHGSVPRWRRVVVRRFTAADRKSMRFCGAT